ncbi:MAG: LysM domain-containing protein, partial [Bdellovibrionota bacterium]
DVLFKDEPDAEFKGAGKDGSGDGTKVDVSKVLNEPNLNEGDGKGPVIFDVGNEEKKLLELSKFVENKIPEKEWNTIASASKTQKYVVQEGDYLWKIAKTLFGSGFYYSKIWSLNPHIANPHEIEPGMVLVFETGDSDTLPSVQLGDFEGAVVSSTESQAGNTDKQFFDFREFGDDAKPEWLDQRKKLQDQGTFFQYSSEVTYEDLAAAGERNLNKEYQKYEPPETEIVIQEPGENYDDGGFDKSSKITFDVKEGFFLNSFVTTNIVQDFGYIDSIAHEAVFINRFDKVYVLFDEEVKVKPGDLFSVYTADGKVSHPVSDRSGYRFTIVAQIKALRKINNVWECTVTDISGLMERKNRVTVYTPKINRIVRTFSKKNIEAAIVDAYRETANGISFGDVVYLDRGRADGVEMGTVFEAYSFFDRGTGKKITPDPTYKIGELTVISLTDDFATAIVSNSSSELGLGAVCLSKTAEQAARAARVQSKDMLKGVKNMEGQALDELDVELNVDELSDDLLKKADSVQLTEDELEELERQEREKSVIQDQEKDLKELDRLESEILENEGKLNEVKVDEDKFLEQQDLNKVEKNNQAKQAPNSFESLEDIEQELGRQYMDEDLNVKDNPYGLSEFDLEEIDELLNTGSDSKK